MKQLQYALEKIGFKPPKVVNDNEEDPGEDTYDEHIKKESDQSNYV